MAQMNEIYKCNECGNLFEVIRPGTGKPACCGKPMELLNEKTEDEGKEKHVPVIEKIDGDNRVRIKIGSVPHPMEKGHYIEWIEIITGDRVLRKYLKAGEKPEKEFTIRAGTFTAREHCNVHGLWKS